MPEDPSELQGKVKSLSPRWFLSSSAEDYNENIAQLSPLIVQQN